MNWDKPLSQGKATNAKELSTHHGLSLPFGKQWRKLVGANVNDDFYKVYISYCNIMSSPLGQALS